MTIVTGTFTTFSAKGMREDLTDVIYNISPTETPFMTGIGRTKAEATFHEWQTDSLATAKTNAQIQGDDISSFDSVTATTRLGNYTQISRATVVIADTEDQIRKAGRKSEVAYQVAKKGKELKRDIEYQFVGLNQSRSNGTSSVAPLCASTLSWIKTNTDMSDGAASNPSAADGTSLRTDSTNTRAFTEAQFKGVLKGIFTNSGDEPEMAMVYPAAKQTLSTFTGNSTRMIEATERKLVAAIDVYTYDFGTVRVVANRFMRTRDVLIINTDLWAVAWLRPIKLVDLAKTGDATKKMLIGEYTLESRNEAGSGGVFDLA